MVKNLDYYIDGGCNTTSTVVWFGLDQLVKGDTTIHLTYGKPSLTNNSNINNFSFGSLLSSTNNKLWLSANVASSSLDNTAISSWTDRSGNNNTVVQGTGANQPTIQTNELSSLPAIRFDLTNDRLVKTTPTRITFWQQCLFHDHCLKKSC
ncbi:MAG: DUF2341 domain-containing protein [Thermales bacterium]|nr:DUF2341 domain-containing protein [Thermales bacterium]